MGQASLETKALRIASRNCSSAAANGGILDFLARYLTVCYFSRVLKATPESNPIRTSPCRRTDVTVLPTCLFVIRPCYHLKSYTYTPCGRFAAGLCTCAA